MKVLSNPRHAALDALARTYLPQWRFSAEQPDSGSVVALLVDDMLAQGEKRLQMAMHKYRIQYLNLFERLAVEPVEASKSYVRFTQVSGMEHPVHVPRGTELVAEDAASGQRLIFETTSSITTSPARLMGIYATDLATDRIICLAEFAGEAAVSKPFFAFDLSGENQAEHYLDLSFDTALDAMDGLRFGLLPGTQNPEDQETALEALTGSHIQYSMLEPGGEYLFDQVHREGSLVWLEAPGYQPQKVEQNGKIRYVLRIRAKKIPPVRLTSAGLVFAGDNIPPDEVAVNGVAQQPGRFFPFGEPMEIYSECAIECRQAFARRGARVEMAFHLDFRVLRQKLPEALQEQDLKVVMRRPGQSVVGVEAIQVRADDVLLEYRSRDRGWRRLLLDEHTAALFNGSAQGELNISFVLPVDIEEEDGEPRLRLRLLRADGLYSIPNVQSVPVISGLRFSYRYEDRGLLPDNACTINNGERVDVTEKICRQREFPLFYSREHGTPCLYLGFDQSPRGMPFSLYFEVENDEDHPLDYTVEYLRADGFVPMQPIDHTCGLLYSGTLLLPVPEDCTAQERFGRRAYWLRLTLRRPVNGKLPLIRRVDTNMVRVENRRTTTEYFYMEDPDAPLIISLGEQNLITASVYVNEEGGNPQTEDNWVRWSKRAGREQRGRYCDVDLGAGTVRFYKNAFAPYPLREGRPAVKVEYQSFQGSQANVAAGRINTLTQSLKYIASVSNPMAAFGGYDSFNEESSAAAVSNLLRTRGRAVTARDYYDVIQQVSRSVRRIKCMPQSHGEDAVAIALLIDEYEKGSHMFSVVKDAIHQKLLQSSIIASLGKKLILSQPHFLRFSVRIWLDCSADQDPYEMQELIRQSICAFIDPLKGGFEGNGWEIGSLPTVRHLIAWLKMKRPGIHISWLVMSAAFQGREYAVDDDIEQRVDDPFAMAVNGDHAIYVDLSGR